MRAGDKDDPLTKETGLYHSKPIALEQRTDIIAHMAASLLQNYHYYLSQRQSSIPRRTPTRTARHDTAKVGRNDPCPGGSGKKYKQCHGGTTLH
jgi:uncharacterized protein YecA (UPF0149 family)